MIRPYNGGPGGPAQQRVASEPRHQLAMSPFGGDAMSPFGGGGLFAGGRDPFQGFGGFGGDPFGGSIMRRFEDMTKDMMRDFSGPGGLAAGSAGRGGGQFSCQTFAMSSVMGPDGKMHTERYSSSDIGNRDHGIRESQQAYSNSSTGVDKMGLERQLGDRARKMVKERDRNTMEERSTEMFRGMDEGGRDMFDRDFQGKAHYMPQHGRISPAALQGPMQGGRPQLALGSDAGSSYGGNNHVVQRHRSMPSGGRRR
mmetsp:Transcript_129531/g.360880  ORF Transcript_129531/g.360880 Transcript_129531/m.360880 type:complete len:255 (+) Transcript_129531:113-877(+)